MAHKKVKTVYKLKWKNIGLFLSFIFIAALLIFGGYKAIVLFCDYNKTKDVIKSLDKDELVENIVDDEFTSTIKQPSTLSKFDAHWDYVKLGLIDVEMAKLKRVNADTVGFIEVKGTDFSYPVVQGSNDFYKSHSFDKSKNSFGWVYLDEKNSSSEMDTKNIIYGNKVLGNMLMSSLNKVFKEEWNSETDNYIIRYVTNNYSSLWRIISVYKAKDTEHLMTDFDSSEDLQSHIDKLIKKSEFKFKTEALATDNFLILTTNSKNNNIVILAKLIKIKKEQ